MTSPRLLGLLALSLIESDPTAPDALVEGLARIAADEAATRRYLELVEEEAIRLSAKRSASERKIEAKRARHFAETLLNRAHERAA